MSEKKKPLYHDVGGFLLSKMFSPACAQSGIKYKARPDDLFIVTYPKCGTTWIQNIILHIFRKGIPLTHPQQFFQSCPYLEMVGSEICERMPRPGAIKTHLSYQLTPKHPEAKYIYIARNPKDCCVSFFNHTKMIPGYDFIDGEFDVYFELFIKGEVDYGSFVDHLLPWYERRNDPNVFFSTYETMKKDIRGFVMKLAAFMGKEYIDAIEKDLEVLERIIHYTSFNYMENAMNHLLMNTFDTEDLDNPALPEGIKYGKRFMKNQNIKGPIPEMKLVRKGIVGDWKEYFSPEQSKRMDEWFLEKTRGTDLAEMWKKEMEYSG